MISSNIQSTNIRVRASAGQWSPSLVQSALLQAEEFDSVRSWVDYIDLLHQVQGLTWIDWQYFVSRYHRLGRHSPSLLLRLLNHVLASDLPDSPDKKERDAQCYALCAKSNIGISDYLLDIKQSGYLGTCVSHYPGILITRNVSYISFASPHFVLRTHNARADELSALKSPFKNALSQVLPNCTQCSKRSSPRIAVVGNSPTLLHDVCGQEIDSADVVIRFNNTSDLHNKSKHTGTRTDIWVTSPSTSVKLCPHDAKLVIVSGLNALDRPSFYWKRLPSLGRQLSQFPSSVWYELVRRFDAPPSAGTLLLAALDSLNQKLDVKCYGFTSNDDQLAKLPNHHADDKPRSARHNWAAEAQWLGNRLT